jgi:hypothetical protein
LPIWPAPITPTLRMVSAMIFRPNAMSGLTGRCFYADLSRGATAAMQQY